MEVPDRILRARQDVWAGEEYEGLIVINDHLDAVIEVFPLVECARIQLQFHQLVNFRFPGCGGFCLAKIPEMRGAARKPDIYVRVWVGVKTHQTKDASVVFFGLRHSIKKRAEFKRYYLNAHAELFQVILDKCGHFCPLSIRGTNHNGEFDRGAR